MFVAPRYASRGGTTSQALATESRYVQARIDAEHVVAKPQRAGDPGQRLALLTSADPHLEGVGVGGFGKKFVSLFVGGDAPGRAEPADDSLDGE